MRDYDLLEQLLETEWHVLHRGRRRGDGRPVLLKVARGGSRRAAASDLLEREYEIRRDLSVPGVPRAYEVGREDSVRFLVLEDPGGAPLDTLLRSGRLPPSAFYTLGIQLCAVLAELHRRDITHAGINPRSILVHPASHEPWLDDFSFATRGQGGTAVPVSRLLLGSALPYLSPEQTGRMNRVVDYRTDFYSLGVTF